MKRCGIHAGKMFETDMIHLGVYRMHLKGFDGAGLQDGMMIIETG